MSDVDALVSKLEEALVAHGGAPARGYLRDGIVRDLKAKLGAQPQESSITNAVHELLGTAPDKKAFSTQLERLKQQNVPCVGNFLLFLQQAHSNPSVKQSLANMTPAHERQAYAQSTAQASQTAAATAATSGSLAAAAASRGRVSRSSSQAAATTVDQSPAPRSQAAGSTSTVYQSNPVYGQDMTSPLPRTREYTPTLQPDMAARQRPARPVLPDVGDLLSPLPPSDPHHRPPKYLDRIPEWNSERPYLTGLHIVQESPPSSADTPPLETLPQSVQESVVVNDLLYAFMGLEGALIRPQVTRTEGRTQVAFSAPRTLHPCLLELVERMLPICEYVVVLKRFIETRSSYTFGMTSQALAAAMREVVSDWQLMAAQMEHQHRLGQLSLQATLYFCQQPQHSLHLLASIAAAAASQPNLTSAGVLDLLHTRWASLVGDPPSRALVHRLLVAAAAPYFRILEAWLFRGVLDDPYGEFMVQEDQSIVKSDWTSDSQLAYWYKRYTIRQRPSSPGNPGGPDVPVMLLKVADVVLTTGKYLNAIRECGQQVASPVEAGTRLQYDAAHGYVVLVERAHTHASAVLLDFLRREHHLQDWLHSIKHYFLLDQGDLMVHLLESAKEELSKPASEVLRSRVQSLLELAVRTSSVASDPLADNVYLDMNPRPLHELVRDAFPDLYLRSSGSSKADVSDVRRQRYVGWQAMMLGYRVGWPLTLVVAQRQVQQYQIIFKHLFLFKFAERELAATWHLLQATRSLGREGQAALRPCHGVCSRMMFLLQECLRYATTDILEPSWGTLLAGLKKASNIDQVIDSHTEFLRRALQGMLLTHKGVVRLYPALQQTCLDFCALVHLNVQLPTDSAPSSSIDGMLSKSYAQRDALRKQRQSALQAVASDPNFRARVLALRDDFAARTKELLAAFTGHVEALLRMHNQDVGGSPHSTSVRTSLGGGAPPSSQDSADIREEVEGLKNLIDRLSI